MMLYHGSNLEIDTIDLSKCRPRKDFGQGFYLTDIPEQAMRMAKRVARIYGGEPVVTCFETDIGTMAERDFSVLAFDKPDLSWAAFVMKNRSQSRREQMLPDCIQEKPYDLVIGPVANDDLAFLFRQFEEGLVSIETLTREMTYKSLTTQYCFRTQRAVDRLKKAGVLK